MKKRREPIYNHYVSAIDRLLQNYDHTHKPSLTQKEEQNKYETVNLLRDTESRNKPVKKMWDEF